MINVTSQYAAQTFLAPAAANIIAQVDSNNNTRINTFLFPKKYRRVAFAQTAPDGSGAQMHQIDVLINPSAVYACQTLKEAQSLAFETGGYLGNEYYIEAALSPQSYSILTWASNI